MSDTWRLVNSKSNANLLVSTAVNVTLGLNEHLPPQEKGSCGIAGGGISFLKKDAVKGLTPSEKKKFDNFLQRMKRLNALRAGQSQGEWIFPNRLIKLYLYLESLGLPGRPAP